MAPGLTLGAKKLKEKRAGKKGPSASAARLAETAGRPAQGLVFFPGISTRRKAASLQEKFLDLAPALEGGGAGPPASVCEACSVGDVSCGATSSGQLLASDCAISDGSFVDAWALEVTDKSKTVTVTLRSAVFDTFLFVVPTDCGEPLGANDDCAPGDASQSCVTLELAPGKYFVVVNSFDAGEQGDYEVTFECLDFSLCRDCVAGDITCGQNFSDELLPGACVVPGDNALIDLWRFEVKNLSTVSFTALSQQFDTVAMVLDSTCQVLAQNDDCSLTTLDACVRALLESGTYFLGVRAFNAGEFGNYEVIFDCVDLGISNDCRAGTIACGDTTTGSLAADSCTDPTGAAADVWNFEVDASATLFVDVSLHGEDTQFEIRDVFFQTIVAGAACPEGSGPCQSVAFDPGSYFVKVSKSTAGGGSIRSASPAAISIRSLSVSPAPSSAGVPSPSASSRQIADFLRNPSSTSGSWTSRSHRW